MNDATQTGVAMAAIAMISTVIGLVVGYFKDRDKLRYDSEMTAVKAQNAAQARQMAEQELEIAELKRTHADCEQQHQETQVRLTQIEQRLAEHLNRGTATHTPLPSA